MRQDICQAINERRMLRVYYDPGMRLVEPHCYGANKNGHQLLRVYQVTGASESAEPAGWKLLNVQELRRIEVLDQTFQSARPGYKKRDKAMDRQIFAEL